MESKTEPKNKNLIEYLEIFQAEIANMETFVKDIEHINNPHKRMIVKDLTISLQSAQSQLKELANELREKP